MSIKEEMGEGVGSMQLQRFWGWESLEQEKVGPGLPEHL